MEEQEKIIAYRIGESLFCPECYEESAKALKAVQNPEDPQVTFPSKPIKAGTIKIFACNQCGVVKGSVSKKSDIGVETNGAEISMPPKKILEPRRRTISEKREAKDLIEVQDMINDCKSKLALIDDFLVNLPLEECPEISESGSSGICIILDEIQGDLDFSVNEISRMRKKGLIVEKRE